MVARHGIHPANRPQYRFYCSIKNCDWGIEGSKMGFARKDRAKRHITTIHPGYPAEEIQIEIQ
jgi:hypothetical protein